MRPDPLIGTRRFHRSLGWAFAMNWGQRAIGLLTTFVLAGILGPAEFGTVAIAMVYIGFLQLFLEQGLGAAIVQRETLEPEHLDAAFWMNVGWSVLLAASSVGLGSWWARINDLPRLTPVIGALSIGLLVQGLTVVHESVLERAMRFRRLAIYTNVSAVGGAAVGVALAVGGAGLWALVAQQLANAVIWLGLVWTGSGWRPALRFSPSHARRLLGFSLQVFAGNLGLYAAARLDILLIGFYAGATAAGLYRVATRLVDSLLELTTRPVRAITLAHLSRLQSAPDALRDAVETCIHTSCLLAVPGLFVLAACSRQVVALLGPAWTPAADALALLCLVGVGKAVIMFTGPTLQAVGRPYLRTLAVWALVAVSAPLLALSAASLHTASTRTQVVGMAAAMAAVFVLLFVPASLLLVQRAARLRVLPLFARIAPSFAAGVAAMATTGAVAATGLIDSASPPLALIVTGSLATTAAGMVLLLCEPAIVTTGRALVRRAFGQDDLERGVVTLDDPPRARP